MQDKCTKPDRLPDLRCGIHFQEGVLGLYGYVHKAHQGRGFRGSSGGGSRRARGELLDVASSGMGQREQGRKDADTCHDHDDDAWDAGPCVNLKERVASACWQQPRKFLSRGQCKYTPQQWRCTRLFTMALSIVASPLSCCSEKWFCSIARALDFTAHVGACVAGHASLSDYLRRSRRGSA